MTSSIPIRNYTTQSPKTLPQCARPPPVIAARLHVLTKIYSEYKSTAVPNQHLPEKQAVYQMLYDDILEHENVWFNMVLDVNRKNPPNFAPAERMVVILLILCVSQTLNGEKHQPTSATLDLARRVLQRYRAAVVLHGNNAQKMRCDDCSYHLYQVAIGCYVQRGRKEDAVDAFRMCAEYEIKRDKINIAAILLQQEGMSMVKILKMSDEEIWKYLDYHRTVKSGPRCKYCHIEETETREKFQLCGRCQDAVYCSRECQKADWKEHKKVCEHKDYSKV